MKGVSGTRLLMRIFIQESDHFEGQPLYLALLRLFQREGLSGGTALRGIAGFGVHSALHTDRFLDLSDHLPTVVEVIDQEARVRALLPTIDTMMQSGLVTFEQVEVISYSHPKGIPPE